ncbi:uncharacterized protein LOC118109629 isoform X2 [Hippoglossus stenolepis]|uniref:uncharacterized protein LOC118109629 isoform X2 n=1 Tax=Hippoglossus stenolepis TaxID=195615 RepID=UPI00159C8D74|nr:uncharacterized protein LOC118109629 isoform X2 [Hippoglossus stenolepis]
MHRANAASSVFTSGLCHTAKVRQRDRVELHERHGDTIPEGWGCDAQGKLTTDPKRVLDGGGLVPIGGSEATGTIACGKVLRCSQSQEQCEGRRVPQQEVVHARRALDGQDVERHD